MGNLYRESCFEEGDFESFSEGRGSVRVSYVRRKRVPTVRLELATGQEAMRHW